MIGILYPGELGSAIGALLRESGQTVVTSLAGRSDRTRARALEAGLIDVGSIREVALGSRIVISTVPPDAALSVARSFQEAIRGAGGGRIYVDANTVTPETVKEISRTLRGCGARFVDASVHGHASGLRSDALLYLSGQAERETESIFSGLIRVRTLGSEPGLASAVKELLDSMDTPSTWLEQLGT